MLKADPWFLLQSLKQVIIYFYSQFVYVGGSPNRMKAFALFMHKELRLEESGEDVRDICAGMDRYCVYKTGPVLAVSVSTPRLCSGSHHKLAEREGTSEDRSSFPLLLCLLKQLN